MAPYQRLNPLATAVAAACLELVGALLVGFPMAGMMGGYGHGYMMGGWGFGWGYGVMWISGAVLFGLAGAMFAWVYNGVNGAVLSQTQREDDSKHGQYRANL